MHGLNILRRRIGHSVSRTHPFYFRHDPAQVKGINDTPSKVIGSCCLHVTLLLTLTARLFSDALGYLQAVPEDVLDHSECVPAIMKSNVEQEGV